MKLGDVRSIAKSHSIKPNHLSKSELIKAIQTEERNFAGTYSGECDQVDRLWREDCFDAVHHKGELSLT